MATTNRTDRFFVTRSCGSASLGKDRRVFEVGRNNGGFPFMEAAGIDELRELAQAVTDALLLAGEPFTAQTAGMIDETAAEPFDDRDRDWDD